MRSFFLHHILLCSVAGLLVVGVGYMVWDVVTSDPLSGIVTAIVTRGTVEQIVSVSGLTKAANTAELAFPTPGVVSNVYVDEGATVAAGDILASIGNAARVAERMSAVADLHVAEADLAELLAGDTAADRTLNSTKVSIARAELERVKSAGAVAVENAERTLRSSNLAAQTTDSGVTAPAPTISGTYRCTTEGTYKLTVYNSAANSGYSFRYTGLETGTSEVSTDQPTPFGTCGLLIQFTKGARYNATAWVITIPNMSAASYTANKNALVAIKNSTAAAIETATQALTLASETQFAQNAEPRSEAVARAEARISKVRAQIAQIDAALADLVIRSPFTGTVTRVDILPGETAGVTPVITVLATDKLELTARIPEIDVTDVTLGQTARVIFDAETTTTLPGTVSYIAPLPIQIDGVAYFEVKILLETIPAWLRGGLNADIDIIIASKADVLRVPKRYVVNTGETSSVRTLTDSGIATTTVIKIFDGNDGFVAIEGLAEGSTVVTP